MSEVRENWIDISEHQGNIDLNAAAASGVKGVTLRAGFGDDSSQADKKFIEYIKAAIAAKLKIAIYWFNYCDSPADALKEWAICKQIIETYRQYILFVAADYEYASVSYYRRIHGADPSRDLINQMVNAFLGAAKADGWDTKLYTNIDYSRNVFTAQTLQMWKLWVAYYSGDPGMPYDILQTGSIGHVPGIPGNVDTDIYINRDSADAPAPVPTPKPAPQPTPAPTPTAQTYTVKYGDTLSGIAAKFGTTYQHLAAINGIADPNKISAGKVLNISGSVQAAPAATQQAVTYTIKYGDTLSGIAAKFGTTYQHLAEINGIANPNKISAGQTIKIR